MTGKSLAIILLFLSLIVTGCAGKTVFSVEVYKTPTQPQEGLDPLLTATPASQPAPTMEPFPTFTPTAAAMPQDFSPILYGEKYDANTFFLLLGGVQGGKWLTPEQAAARIGGAGDYDVRTFANESFEVRGDAPVFSPAYNLYTIGTNTTLDEFGMVAVAHGWPLQQVNAREISGDQGIYQTVVLDWLKDQGVPDPQLGMLRIFRLDLEGDGVDEIFIGATRLDDSQHNTKQGDYSIILMRKVVGNEAVTLPLVADIYRSRQPEVTYPSTYSLANFIDLNRDGILEVVVDYQRWEGDGAMIYQILGQKVTRVP